MDLKGVTLSAEVEAVTKMKITLNISTTVGTLSQRLQETFTMYRSQISYCHLLSFHVHFAMAFSIQCIERGNEGKGGRLELALSVCPADCNLVVERCP